MHGSNEAPPSQGAHVCRANTTGEGYAKGFFSGGQCKKELVDAPLLRTKT